MKHHRLVVPSKRPCHSQFFMILLQLVHHSLLTAHRGNRRMYNTLRCEYYRLNISKDVYSTVRHCKYCSQIDKRFRIQHQLHLPPSGRLLDSIATGIYGPILRSNSGYLFVFISTDRYSSMNPNILTREITSVREAYIFLVSFVIPYRITKIIFSEKC